MRFLLLGAFFIFCGNLSAQKKESTVFLKVQYGGQFPLLDDKNRFGPSLRPMMVLSKETKKKENVSSITGFFQFGTLVKESVFDHLLTPEGYLIGNDKNPAAIQLRQRAWFLGAGKGWRFVEKSNFLNRCALEVSAGFFQHKIRIQEDPQRLVPQISGEYKKGYDRLSSGPGLYVSWSFNPTANPTETRFVVGMDVFAAHTNHRRPVHFNTGLSDPSSFWVLQPGVHLGYHFKKVFKDPAAIKY